MFWKCIPMFFITSEHQKPDPDSPPAPRRLLAVGHGGSQGGVGYDSLARVVDGHARHLLPRGRNEDLLRACRPALLQKSPAPDSQTQPVPCREIILNVRVFSRRQLVLLPAPACQAECEETGTTGSGAPGVPSSPSSAGIQRPCWRSAGLPGGNKLMSQETLTVLPAGSPS